MTSQELRARVCALLYEAVQSGAVSRWLPDRRGVVDLTAPAACERVLAHMVAGDNWEAAYAHHFVLRII